MAMIVHAITATQALLLSMLLGYSRGELEEHMALMQVYLGNEEAPVDAGETPLDYNLDTVKKTFVSLANDMASQIGGALEVDSGEDLDVGVDGSAEDTADKSPIASLLELGADKATGFPGLSKFSKGTGAAPTVDMHGQPGFHPKLLEAQPKLKENCSSTWDADDCKKAEEILEKLVQATMGPEPDPWTHQAFAWSMTGITSILYVPGTSFVFGTLDANHDGAIQMSDLWQVWGEGIGRVVYESNFFPMYEGAEKDGNVTKTELYNYAKALMLVRDVVPSLDMVDPTAPTQKCLGMVKRITLPPPTIRPPMNKFKKLLCIAAIMSASCALHCILTRMRPESKAES